MSCCSGGMKYYNVVGDGILVTKEGTMMGMWSIAKHTHKFFGTFLPNSFHPITCQKMVSSKFDEAIEYLQEKNDWEKHPVCGMKYLPKERQVEILYTERQK